MSADLGNARERLSYVLSLVRGEGVEKDLVSAVRYFQMAIDLGHPGGMLCYSTALEKGEGIERDSCSALRDLTMAVTQWDSDTIGQHGGGVSLSLLHTLC
jgi:TPR repeat protein